MPQYDPQVVRPLLQAAIERAQHEAAAVIDVKAEVEQIKAQLPAGTPVDDAALRTELARLAAANCIAVRM